MGDVHGDRSSEKVIIISMGEEGGGEDCVLNMKLSPEPSENKTSSENPKYSFQTTFYFYLP
ncbi:hypothetical protein HMPREF3156_00467 [Neisseria sp. HMSC06F02]|nr:hypothetical protein HMPREF3156_00467 [Neisseria sp. HMSC06F02]